MPRKNSKHLTDPGIAKIGKAPKGKRIERFDAGAPGLALRVTDRGVKSWSVYFRLHGKHRRSTIGTYPDIGVAEARERAGEIKKQAKQGVDPKVAADAEQAAAQAGAQTFGAIAEKYIKRECPGLRRGWEVERIIRRELMPGWRPRPIADLRKRDAIQLTDALIDAGKPAAAHRLFEIIRRIGRWASRRDEIDFNPFADMDPPVAKVMRDRVLKPDEIGPVWSAWSTMGYPFGPLGKLLLTTMQRLNEVARMEWPEIDRDNRVWIIPATRTKNGRETEVALSSLALEIIDTLPRFTEGEFVFTTQKGERPVSGFSKMKSRTDDLSGVNNWRLHDLRRTARTGLAEIGVPEIIAEKVLNHAERNVLARIYNRHEYADEKRQALERWATRLREITEPPPENVVRFKAAK